MTPAYEAGQQDFVSYQDKNPYEDGTEEYKHWLQGWQECGFRVGWGVSWGVGRTKNSYWDVI